MKRVEVLIVCSDELFPSKANPGDAGYDLRSAESTTLAPGQRQTIPTGVRLAMPEGYVALVHPRSGLAAKSGITVLNAPGTVDAGYRGEIAVTMINLGEEEFTVSRGDRIAQMVFQRFEEANFLRVEDLPGSMRGVSGFGSTGVS